MRRPALAGAGMPTRQLFGRGHPEVRGAAPRTCLPKAPCRSTRNRVDPKDEPWRLRFTLDGALWPPQEHAQSIVRRDFRRIAPLSSTSVADTPHPPAQSIVQWRRRCGHPAWPESFPTGPRSRVRPCASSRLPAAGTWCLSARPPWPRAGAAEPVVRAARKDPPEPLPPGAACGNATCWDVCAGRERHFWDRRGSPATR